MTLSDHSIINATPRLSRSAGDRRLHNELRLRHRDAQYASPGLLEAPPRLLPPGCPGAQVLGFTLKSPF